MEGYKNLTTYILAIVIHDLTVQFCKKYIDPKSRTVDQMTQAARSTKQNIAEGYSFESLASYIKLLGVSRGSVKELVCDYEDYLRQHNLKTWPKESRAIREIRDFRARWISPNRPNTPNLPNSPEETANTLLTFCQMESYLLDKQIDSLKAKFIREGGRREKLFKERLAFRKKNL